MLSKDDTYKIPRKKKPEEAHVLDKKAFKELMANFEKRTIKKVLKAQRKRKRADLYDLTRASDSDSDETASETETD